MDSSPSRAGPTGPPIPGRSVARTRIRTRLGRTLKVFRSLLPYMVAFLRDRRRWILFGAPARRSEKAHQVRAHSLTRTLAELGPTFVKLAQILGSRSDILPEPYVSEIRTLQDRVPPDPTDRVVAVLEDELGMPVGEAFERFDRDPVATASLGQVHQARVDGREVVVKVLRPGVERLVALDLDISFRVLFWLNILFPNHHVRGLTGVVREFSVRVREEMDFEREADNIRHFRTAYQKEGRVRAPEVIDRFTRRRVLVMERVRGTKVDELHARFADGDLELGELMETLSGLYLRMMMVDGFLHADPHPGNILVEDDGTIVLIDWGMVLRVPRWTREAILHMALAVEREDLDAIINGMYRLGMISPEVSRGEIREAAEEIIEIMSRARVSNRDRVQEIVHQLFDTFYTWPLVLPEELVYFFRAAVLLEGLAVRYDPAFDGLGFIRQVIRHQKAAILRATGREPTAVAKDLLGELYQIVRAGKDLLIRAEREELRVRLHPRDIQAQERFFHLQARRVLLSAFATATAVITAVLFVALRSYWLLAGGLAVALFMFLLVLTLPTHLLENPLRHARGIRPEEWR